MIRFFDLVFSIIGTVVLLPFALIISVIIIFDSRGGIFFKQLRIGKNGKQFFLFKFRTMYMNSDKKGLITVGMRDSRVTRIGFLLRKYKLDELPQIINIIKGEMSFVGPRPEVEKYVNLYTSEQRKVLSVKPGITDYASIEFSNENEILSKSTNPERTYIKEVMPEKIRLNMIYINNS